MKSEKQILHFYLGRQNYTKLMYLNWQFLLVDCCLFTPNRCILWWVLTKWLHLNVCNCEPKNNNYNHLFQYVHFGQVFWHAGSMCGSLKIQNICGKRWTLFIEYKVHFSLDGHSFKCISWYDIKVLYWILYSGTVRQYKGWTVCCWNIRNDH